VETATAVTSFPASRYDGFLNQSNAVYFQDYINIHPKLQVLVGGRYDAYQHYNYLNPIVGGVEMIGPAIVEQKESTAVLGPSGRASLDARRNLVITLG